MTKKIKSRRWIVILVVVALLIVLGLYSYFSFFSSSAERNVVTISNPVIGLSDQKAVEQFDENFVLYLVVSIGAQDLHNPPFSSDTPKIEMSIGGDIYFAEIKDGGILVGEGGLGEKDIIITTSKEEVVKMLRDNAYIEESFEEGASDFELISGKARLLSKGYIKIYTQFTGNAVDTS